MIYARKKLLSQWSTIPIIDVFLSLSTKVCVAYTPSCPQVCLPCGTKSPVRNSLSLVCQLSINIYTPHPTLPWCIDLSHPSTPLPILVNRCTILLHFIIRDKSDLSFFLSPVAYWTYLEVERWTASK